jgi:hypothetical protein
MGQLGERAIVVGASIGGLMAARVLADFYGEVNRPGESGDFLI